MAIRKIGLYLYIHFGAMKTSSFKTFMSHSIRNAERANELLGATKCRVRFAPCSLAGWLPGWLMAFNRPKWEQKLLITMLQLILWAFMMESVWLCLRRRRGKGRLCECALLGFNLQHWWCCLLLLVPVWITIINVVVAVFLVVFCIVIVSCSICLGSLMWKCLENA